MGKEGFEESKEEKKEWPEFQEVPTEKWRSRAWAEAPSERPQPTPEQKEEMNREIIGTGKLMNESGCWWQLDGGFNVSLLKGEYVGVHVDVDISVERRDLPKIEKYLLEKGFGLFKVNKKKGPKKKLWRVGAEDFKYEEGWNLRFIPIDEDGRHRVDPNIRSIEVAVIERDERGKYSGWRGTPLPEKWLNWKKIDFHGVPIPLSHPAKFFFYKMWFTRGSKEDDKGGYDDRDIGEYLKLNVLTEEDLRDIQRVANQVLRHYEENYRGNFRRISEKRLKQLRDWLKSRTI